MKHSINTCQQSFTFKTQNLNEFSPRPSPGFLRHKAVHSGLSESITISLTIAIALKLFFLIEKPDRHRPTDLFITFVNL